MIGFVYAIECGSAVKIGFARDPKKRETYLQTGSPAAMRLLGYVHGTSDDEARAHAWLRDHRIRGEWFDRQASRVSRFVRLVVALTPKTVCRPMNALEKYFAETGTNALSLARKIGRAASSITRPLNGQRNASMDLALQVEQATEGCCTAEQFLEICLQAKRSPKAKRSRKEAA